MMRKQGKHRVLDNVGRPVEGTGRKGSTAVGADGGCIRIIALCAYCKRFKDYDGTWLPLSRFMRDCKRWLDGLVTR